jgi:protein-S-isoprenylcysteine O-methyltransferase Ste14
LFLTFQRKNLPDMNKKFIHRGGLWVLSQGALLLAIAVLSVVRRSELDHPLVLFGGLLFMTVAAWVGITGLVALGRNLTPFPKPTADAQFVRHGIYALIRHPLYTSVFCAAVGWSLVWQSWLALVTSLALGLFLDAKARHEERWLRQQFTDYAGYERRVRRFIPGIY